MRNDFLPFQDRRHAGRVLAQKLAHYLGQPNLLVLALPRGGVAIGYDVARALQAPLDVLVVRKLGFPGHEEYAMGAIASGGVRVMNPLPGVNLDPVAVAEVVAREQAELVRREQLYRSQRPAISAAGRTVILVDDGLATGSTMRAAVLAVARQHPARLVVAVPVGAEDSCRELRVEVDELVCAATPEPFHAVGLWYEAFPQASDEEVRTLLEQAREEHALAVRAAIKRDDYEQYTPPPLQQALPARRPPARNPLVEGLQQHLQPLTGNEHDYDALLELIGPARFALLGEASHGTHEFYRERAAITRRLILEKGFTAIAVEADWPDAWRVNRYVRGLGDDTDAAAALSGFQRFPAWMWRNTEVRDFVEWLREHNAGRSPDSQVGFYGMDLYSMFTSMQEVLAYLERVDPEAAQRARYRYSCFDHSGEDSQAYGYSASFGLAPSCEDAVVQQLREMTRRAAEMATTPGLERDETFYAQQNARLVRNAEEYYRTMFHARVSSWNLRDSHMVETLQALERHLGESGAPPRMAVWAHNSHLGDASATQMGDRGEWNVGQLMRDRYGSQAVRVGFSTHHGWVTAASNWDEVPQRKRVRPGLHGSWEELLHDTATPRFLLALRDNSALRQLAAPLRLQRAIGVIYRPETERQSHYFYTYLADQFDALIHIDQTSALEPLDKGPVWHTGEAPETYPSGI
ncbi:MAG: erythromycin esterase family protein [Pseudomonadota bacterium]|nr:erythromycin esterase family protein [Pseudomonadota bacterium]